jgi:hypothetical protein
MASPGETLGSPWPRLAIRPWAQCAVASQKSEENWIVFQCIAKPTPTLSRAGGHLLADLSAGLEMAAHLVSL